MKSKTKIGWQLERKSNDHLVATIIAAKKNAKWLAVAAILSGGRRQSPQVNLTQINDVAKDGEVIVVPGKVLSQGEVDKKIKVVAFKFSENAKAKLAKAKIQMSDIMSEIKHNPEAKGVKVLAGRR